jgi:hypothetical protein
LVTVELKLIEALGQDKNINNWGDWLF